MKKVAVIVLLLAAGVFAGYLYTHGGSGSKGLSPEQQQIQALEERIDADAGQIAQAGQAAGMSGLDTTSEAGAALGDLERIEQEIRELSRNTESEEIRSECARLLEKVEATRR